MDILNCLEYIENAFELNDEQELLLKALIAPEPENINALSEWISRIDFDEIDYFTLKMIPALFYQFRNQAVDNQYMGRMKGIYRYFLGKNSLVMSDARAIIKKLVDAGIELILFKGAALSLSYYPSFALRTMGDVDALIKKEHLQLAEKIILANGWKYKYGAQRAAILHSCDYVNSRNHGFDLHWFSLSETLTPKVDDGIWQRARSFDWNGISVKIMAPEDLIMTGMINGFRDIYDINNKNMALDINWIYDIAQIIRTEKFIDWQIVYEEAKRRDLSNTIFYAMSLINHFSDDLLSYEVLRQLFRNNHKFCKNYLQELISEGRTHGIKPEKRKAAYQFAFPSSTWRIFGRRKLEQKSSKKLPNKYIKYSKNSLGEIEEIFFRKQFIPFISDIFDVQDKQRLRLIAEKLRYGKDIHLKVGNGKSTTVALKKGPGFVDYSAQLIILEPNLKERYSPNEMVQIDLKVTNTSRHCWVFNIEDNNPLGVSWHLYSSEGELIRWDNFRRYINLPRKNYINFIIPEQEILCTLNIKMPENPGNYKFQLDLVHEYITWFSLSENQFPSFNIEIA